MPHLLLHVKVLLVRRDEPEGGSAAGGDVGSVQQEDLLERRWRETGGHVEEGTRGGREGGGHVAALIIITYVRGLSNS